MPETSTQVKASGMSTCAEVKFGPWGPKVTVKQPIDPDNPNHCGYFLFVIRHELGFHVQWPFRVSLEIDSPIKEGEILSAHMRTFVYQGHECSECEVVRESDGVIVAKMTKTPIENFEKKFPV